MSEQAIAVRSEAAALVLSSEQLDLVKRTVFPGATNDELQLYIHDCARQGVHPLDRLIHPTVRKDKNGNRRYTPITSIDLMRSRAEDTGCYAGNDDPVFTGEPKKPGFAATVTTWKLVSGQRCPFTATARWEEYKPAEDFMWNRMPHVMLGKVAEALALRKAFPRLLGGIYAREEMEQAGPMLDGSVDPPRTEAPPPKTNGGPRELSPDASAKFEPPKNVEPPKNGDPRRPDDVLIEKLQAASGTKGVSGLAAEVKKLVGDNKSHPLRKLYEVRYREEAEKEKRQGGSAA